MAADVLDTGTASGTGGGGGGPGGGGAGGGAMLCAAPAVTAAASMVIASAALRIAPQTRVRSPAREPFAAPEARSNRTVEILSPPAATIRPPHGQCFRPKADTPVFPPRVNADEDRSLSHSGGCDHHATARSPARAVWRASGTTGVLGWCRCGPQVAADGTTSLVLTVSASAMWQRPSASRTRPSATSLNARG